MIKEKEAKQIIVKSNLADEVDYVINPYTGCFHQCVYCYARFMKRFTGHKQEWGQFCDIKINAVELAKKQAPQISKKNPKAMIFLSSVCDPYQSVEQKYKLTRGILEVLVDYDFEIQILTKSDLVLRDLDILKKMSAKGGSASGGKNVSVGFTMNTLKEQDQQMIELGANSPQRRLLALKQLKSKGIRTYGFISPVLPEITDLGELIKEISPHVEHFYVETLNTYASSWKALLACFEKKRPDLIEKYKEIFLKPANKAKYIADVKKQTKELEQKYKKPIKVIVHGK